MRRAKKKVAADMEEVAIDMVEVAIDMVEVTPKATARIVTSNKENLVIITEVDLGTGESDQEAIARTIAKRTLKN